MKRVVTPGTFDPITNGHLEIITRACSLADEVIVAVAPSEKKHPLLSLEQRVALAREACSHLPQVRVMVLDGMLVDFVRENNVDAVVKGLRAITDFEYEFQQTALNMAMDATLETVFIMSSLENMYLSSSVVREIALLKGDFARFVPPCVVEPLKAAFI